MCGIGGVVYMDKNRTVRYQVLKGMADVMQHRGPDDEGFYIDSNAGLCFRRLSIIDLNMGHQPLTSNVSGMTIVFNGEIYNFQEKRKLLIKKGYVFNTLTDTEVILHLYEEYGVKCLDHLQGMFSFAIWDPIRRRMFCARDRFGIKPFYYSTNNGKFAFGSEIKVVMNSGEIDQTISYEALDSYFAFGHITGELSIYKHIRKLKPGHYLMASFGDNFSVETFKYWEIKFEPDHSKSVNYWMDEIKNCLSETVRLHMISDVPLGAFLSGGIDSSSVVSMMAKNSSQPLKTFSIGFKEKGYSELPFARLLAQKYGLDHHEQIIEPESVTILPLLVRGFDEPFADSSAIPTWYISKIAREQVTVALSGDGGDELFAGYNHYAYLKRLYSFPFTINSPALSKIIWGGIHKIIPGNMHGKNAAYLFSKSRNFISAYLNMFSQKERDNMFLIDRDLINLSSGSELYNVEVLKNGIKNDFLSNMQYLDLQTYLVDDILTKVDRASMLNSLEVRVPLLDHKFAELTFKIPSDLKLKDNQSKYIFKKAMSDYLPETILTHPKQGFVIPVSHWFKENLNEYVRDILLSANPYYSDYLDKQYIKKLVLENFSGKKASNTRLWSLLFFEEWLKQNRKVENSNHDLTMTTLDRKLEGSMIL